MKRKLSCWVLLLCVLCVTSANAADIPTILQQNSGAFDAGRASANVQATFPKQTKTPASIREINAPVQTPVNPADKIRFKLTKVIFSGNTIVKTSELDSVFASHLNQVISLSLLQNLVGQITAKYRSSGYILSRAILPPQEIKHGVVHVQVIEGFISKISVNGDPGKLEPLLQGYGKLVLKSHPLKIETLEHYVLLANNIPGVKIKSVLTPSKNIPGSADLTVFVDRSAMGGYVGYDNYGTRYLGPNETTLSGSLYSLLVPGDSNTVRVLASTNEEELNYLELAHAQPLGYSGLNMRIGGNYTQTKPNFILLPLEIVGRSVQGYTDFSYPLMLTRATTWAMHSTLNYQNITSSLLNAPFYSDRLRTFIIGTSIQRQDSWRGINSGAIDLERGFTILGAATHLNQSRPNGQTIFTKGTINLSRLQGLWGRFSLLVGLQGQYSGVPLLATEQYGFGGPDFGRGYDPSSIVGDKGAAGKLELRMDAAPEYKLLQAVQYYTFYDTGVVWNNDKLNLIPKQTAASAGVGARFTFMPHLTGNFFIARPLTLPVQTQLILGRNGNGLRTFFQIVLSS